MSKTYNVAVVGATGAVGLEMIETLEKRNFPVKHLHLFASERSVGKKLKFKVTDGAIVFPKDSAGKHAIAEGTVRLIPLSLEQTRKVKQHEADEQGKPFDPNSVTAPETLVRLDGIGAVLNDKK